MRMLRLIGFYLLSISIAYAQSGFKIVPLGVKGGNDEGNLTSYMVAPAGDNAFLCLDAGTVSSGIRKAIEKGTFAADEATVLKQYIKGYLITHAHLDHVAGMAINAVDDSTKRVYGLASCIQILQDDYFNWKAWPNFTSEGAAPTLKKYIYTILPPDKEITAEHTAMTIRAFPLSHSASYESTAFLIKNNDRYLLYFGDTGPDQIEKSDRMAALWKIVAPLVAAKKLSGIFLEASYPNDQPDSKLFGHLTPKWFMQEMEVLVGLAGKGQMAGLPVVVTHMKPPAAKEKMIRKQLVEANQLGLNLIFPDQGTSFTLK